MSDTLGWLTLKAVVGTVVVSAGLIILEDVIVEDPEPGILIQCIRLYETTQMRTRCVNEKHVAGTRMENAEDRTRWLTNTRAADAERNL